MRNWALGIVACFAILQSSSSLAGHGYYIPKNLVYVPCYNGGFSFGLAALYLRASNPHLDYAVVSPLLDRPEANEFGLAEFRSSNPQFDWGYSINVGYMFPSTATEVRLTYTRLNIDDDVHLGRDDDSEIINIQGGDVDLVSDTDLNNKVSFDYQTLDLDLAQSINIGCSFKLRYFGGLRFADLDNDFDTNFVQGPSPFLIDRVLEVRTHQSSNYQGLGPRFGAEGNYHMGWGVGLVGQVATSVLIGDIDSKYDQRDNFTLDALVINRLRNSHTPNEARVVPNFDARLGLDYHYQFCNYSRTRLCVEAGYQVIHYFNSLDRFASNAPEERTWPGHQTLDTSFDGPYVGVQIKV